MCTDNNIIVLLICIVYRLFYIYFFVCFIYRIRFDWLCYYFRCCCALLLSFFFNILVVITSLNVFRSILNSTIVLLWQIDHGSNCTDFNSLFFFLFPFHLRWFRLTAMADPTRYSWMQKWKKYLLDPVFVSINQKSLMWHNWSAMRIPENVAIHNDSRIMTVIVSRFDRWK